ncbi:hypothetical protein MSIBF_A30003 [groundwater metagenome]|uniref:DUF4062 domain-containing protein n=1 Tax=groundwater metagenome TaxID=717931 RepID=A0A098EBR3_9ZZZZ
MSQENLKRGRGIFKVFLSSTFKDLKEEREEIRNNINTINQYLEIIGMELFVPSEKSPQKACIDELSRCDIYLLLIGESYGSVMEECEIKECDLKNSGCNGKVSYTHCEYRTAIKNKMLPMCFNLFDYKETDESLKKFIDEIKKDKIYLKPIEKANLKTEVKTALNKNINRWVCEGKLKLPEFYGRIGEIKELLDAKPSTIFVKGIGGIGKTTLIEAFLCVKKIEDENILEVVKEIDYNRTDVGYLPARDALERKEYKDLDLKTLAKILRIPVQQDDETIIKSIISALNNRNLILFIDDAHEIKDERVLALIGRCANSLTDGKIILAVRETLKTNFGKIVPVEKGIEDYEFIKSVFKENGIEQEWNKGISDKIMNITSAHPLAVKLVVGNLDHINPDSFTNILKNPHDEKQVKEFIERIVKEILGTDFEKTASLSVYRIPFSLEPNLAKELTGKIIVKKTNGEFFFNYNLIQGVLYASIRDKKQAHKEASEDYRKFEGSNNYKGIAEYLYHLARSMNEDAYSKYQEYKDILSKQGFYREMIDINKELLECVNGNKKKESACYTNLGAAYDSLGYFSKAINYHESSLKIFKDIGDRAGESKCYTNLGAAYQGLGDFRKAINYHESSLKIFKDIGDRAGESKCYTNLGVAYGRLGYFSKAINYHESSLKIFKDIGDRVGESACYTNLGVAYQGLGDFSKAINCHESSLKIFKDIGDRVGESACYTNLGAAYGRLGDFSKAINYYESSLKIKKDIDDLAGESACYTNLGAAYQGLGDFSKAINYHESSLEIDKAIGDLAGESKCYGNLGAAYDSLGDFRKALEYCEKAEKIFKEIGQEHHLKIVYKDMAITYEKMKNPKKADEYKRKSEEI